MRILLVEDNPSLSSWLSHALRKDGYTVDCVSDGEAATHLMLGQQFDAVILDMGLPRLSGREVLGRVRSRGNNVPILVLTAEGGLQARIAVGRLGHLVPGDAQRVRHAPADGRLVLDDDDVSRGHLKVSFV